MKLKILSRSAKVERAGREGTCLTAAKLNPLKSPSSERFSAWGKGVRK